jgi:hypothetical protein
MSFDINFIKRLLFILIFGGLMAGKRYSVYLDERAVVFLEDEIRYREIARKNSEIDILNSAGYHGLATFFDFDAFQCLKVWNVIFKNVGFCTRALAITLATARLVFLTDNPFLSDSVSYSSKQNQNFCLVGLKFYTQEYRT